MQLVNIPYGIRIMYLTHFWDPLWSFSATAEHKGAIIGGDFIDLEEKVQEQNSKLGEL